MKKEEWIKIEDQLPPDEELIVKDEFGNQGIACPLWYPFRVVPNPKKYGKWSSDIVPCDPYWDGEWMLLCDESLTTSKIKGEITHWRKWNTISNPSI